MSELAEVYDALKRRNVLSTNELRKLLESEYSAEWSSKKIKSESVSRTIKRKLEVLEGLSLIKKEKEGRNNIYSIVDNYPVQSKAPELLEKLKDILQEDSKLFARAQNTIQEIANEIKSPYFIRQNIEDIRSKEKIISSLEYAIKKHYYTEITHNNRTDKIKPLKIVEFEGIWYLLYSGMNQKYYRVSISKVDYINIDNTIFNYSDIDDMKIKSWHSIWHDPNKKPSFIKLSIDQAVVQYFYQKNIFDINTYPGRVTEHKNGIEYTLYITHQREILSEIMYWQPHITIVEEDGRLNVTKKLKEIINLILKKQNVYD